MALTHHQKRVAYHIYSVGLKKKASRKDLLSALETGLVESNLGNPAGGDGSSVGWRQETASSYPNVNRMNVRQSASRFYDELRGAGGGSAGQRAQAVQRSKYPAKYDQQQGQAKAVLAWLDKTYGKGTKATVAKASKGTVSKTSTQVVTPGVDNSQARAQVLQQGLGLKHPFALSRLMSTQAQIAGLADVAPVTKTSTQTVVKKGAPTVTKSGGKSFNGVALGVHSPDTKYSARQIQLVADKEAARKTLYQWGGGHGPTTAKVGQSVDCSGFVSMVLGVSPRVASGFKGYGAAGHGKYVTIYAKDSHVLIKIGKNFYAASGKGRITGKVPYPGAAYLNQFSIRHPRGM